MAADATGVVIGWILAAPRMPNYLRAVEIFFHALNARGSRPR
jgi:hypothetical protein